MPVAAAEDVWSVPSEHGTALCGTGIQAHAARLPAFTARERGLDGAKPGGKPCGHESISFLRRLRGRRLASVATKRSSCETRQKEEHVASPPCYRGAVLATTAAPASGQLLPVGGMQVALVILAALLSPW